MATTQNSHLHAILAILKQHISSQVADVQEKAADVGKKSCQAVMRLGRPCISNVGQSLGKLNSGLGAKGENSRS